MGSNSVLKRRGIALISAAILAGGASAMPIAYAQENPAPTSEAAAQTEVPNRPLTEMQSGDLSDKTEDKCDVHWRASAIMDPQLADYANNGYGYKVANRLYPEHFGAMEMQHWMGGHPARPDADGNLPVGPQDFYWRLPIGTSKDLEDVKISVQLPKGFTKPSAENGGYIHLGDQEGPNNYGVDPKGEKNENTIELENITVEGSDEEGYVVTATVAKFPAGKHAVLQMSQKSPEGYKAFVERPEAIADLTAMLPEAECSDEPEPSSEPSSEPGTPGGPGASESSSAKPSGSEKPSESESAEPKPSKSTTTVKSTSTRTTTRTTLKPPATTKTTPKAAAPGASGGGGGSLPVTGAAVVPLAILAASLVGIGAALVIAKRRKNNAG